MQFLISVISDGSERATPSEMAAIDAFNDDQLIAKGHWVFAGGLADPSSSTVIDNRDGQGIFTEGPVVATEDYAIGLWVIDAPSLEIALKLAAEGSRACNRRVEVRAFL